MSFLDSYANIVDYIEAKIAVINTLSTSDAALVAAMANLLDGRNNPPSNMAALQAYLEGKELEVTDSSLIKDVTLLLGASLPSKNTVWKMQEFLSDGDFEVPLNIAGGMVYVTGCGGGPSGQAAVFPPATATLVSAGWSANYIFRRPVSVVAGSAIAVVIGTGGPAQTITTASGAPQTISAIVAGTQSSFGAMVIGAGSERKGAYRPALTTSEISQSSIAYSAGLNVQNVTWPQGRALGAPAGPFGNGPDGVTVRGVNGQGIDAPANSGAPGGSVTAENNTAGSLTAISGVGGSGRIIVEWQEFV